MNNKQGELSENRTEKMPTQQLRKPVKRLNGKVRGVVTPENSPKELAHPSTFPAVESHTHTLKRRRSRAFKNFLAKFKRSNPGSLTAEATSMWRKMSLQEKEQFRAGISDRHKTNQWDANAVVSQVAEEAPSLEIVIDTAAERQIHNDQIHNDQLQESPDGKKLSWLSFSCISKALNNAKNLFH
ncbi:uncharacterized protein LOC127010715 [Drosophila biarmipes]|uniref:uncharacterized protein LOC127010715 n=1 Tax=Drosophila biarmipes TaxID=125945 RepID=UPI0007E8666A|nr:uncharacterized protein LOC127010715 [Drosophila biarmipes]XP_050741258.1 uncharacterized protein LOC127010715 [Drosophila biarmipes]